MIESIKAYFFQGLCLVLVVLVGVQTWRLHNAQLEEFEAKSTLSNERAAAGLALAREERAHREKERSLQAAAEATRKEKDAAITASNAHRDALLKRVRHAKSAAYTCVPEATTDSGNAETGSSHSGGELLGTLGEEDVQEAHRANAIRAELMSCYRQYDDAREALKK